MEKSKLAQARLRKQWTLKQAAEATGVSINTFNRWELGEQRPYRHNVDQLCKIFNTSSEELGFGAEVVSSTPEELGLTEGSDIFDYDSSEDTLLSFQKQDLTLCLMRLVWQWRPRTAHYDVLQAQVIQELESNMQEPITRRDALRRLALLPIEMSSLSLFSTTLKVPAEEILAQCAAGITACWYLRKGKELSFTANITSHYIPSLKIIFQSSTHRKAAANLLAQCYILKSLLAKHVGDSDDQAISYAVQASRYGEVADNLLLQISALRTQANAHDYAEQQEKALLAAEKTKYLLETAKTVEIPPIVGSYIYAGLANYLGQRQQKQEALRMLRKAHNAFFTQASHDRPVWIDHNQANLLLHDGLTHYYLGLQKEARDSFEQISKVRDDRRETTRVEALLDQTLAELQREDRPRDMDYCIRCWEEGLAGAVAMKSQQRFNEAKTIYTAIHAAWPGELRIKSLREHIIHW